MADKYVKLEVGVQEEVIATVQSTGVPEAGDIIALDPTGFIHPSLLPPGAGPDLTLLPTSEDLSAGDLVNIYNDVGIATARKADGTVVGKEAIGYVLEASTSGNNASVHLDGLNTQLSGLTPGNTYYLSDTAGAVTDTPLATPGNFSQRVGKALGTSSLAFEKHSGTILA